MIFSIESDLSTFKPVHFRPGLNVLLSDRAPGSGEKQTRNSAGKTSLIEIVHFLLRGKGEKDSLPRHPALIEHTFRGTFRLGEDTVRVERSGAKPSRVLLHGIAVESLGIKARKDQTSGAVVVSNEEWKDILGHRMFGLPARTEGSAFEQPYTPTFRAMFSYFVRRHASSAFMAPEKQAQAQQRWDWQVNLSYLLGLDWRIPFDLQRVRLREGQLEELKKAAKDGAIGQVIGTVAELRPRVVLAEAKAARLREEISRFQVIESYRDLAARAARAKTEMQAIARRAVSLRETLAHLQNAVREERPPKPDDVTRLYAAVGIELPETARRRFEDVERFHRSVVENRRARLREELDGIESELAEGEKRGTALDAERSEILRLLEGHGALEDFISLQKTLAGTEAEAASLRERFKAAEALEGQTTQLKIDRANIKRRLQEDHHIRKEKLDKAILLIGEAIGELYEDREGKFEVDATENGPEFRISIQGDRGGGIANMEVFCLDLALFAIWTERKRGPGFLIHDSHLFDGVDERQVARALHLGAMAAESCGGQYLVTMNSDIFNRLPLRASLDRNRIVLATRLSDADETGGLFGFRFD